MHGNSAINQLLDISNSFGQALDNGIEIRVFFLCDISKAFDYVWRRGLPYTLKQHGITGRLLQWFSSYMQDRHQQVVLNGCFLVGNQ